MRDISFIGTRFVDFSCKHPNLVTFLIAGITLIITALASLPNIFPVKFSFLPTVKVDTDPENMLKKNEPVRVFHNLMKKEMNIHDIVIVGVVNEKDPDGVFNPDSLKKIYQLTQFAKTLRWKDKRNLEKFHGVIPADIIAPSTVDNIELGSYPLYLPHWFHIKLLESLLHLYYSLRG